MIDRSNLSISSAKTSIALGIHPATNHMYEAECHPYEGTRTKYHGKAAGAVPSSGAAQRNKRKEAPIAKGHGTQLDFAAT